MRMAYRIALTAALCLVLSAGAVQARHVIKDHLVNPSFEEGEVGQEPYGWASEAMPVNDKKAFVKAKGGRPKGQELPKDQHEVQLTVKGDNKKSWGSHLVNVTFDEPTSVTFSAWIKADGAIPAGDFKPAISVEGLKLDKDANRWVTPEGGGRKSTEFVPTAEWSHYSVTKVFPPETERLKVAIGTYTRNVIISADDLTLTWGLAVPDFDVEKEAAALEQLLKDAGKDNQDAAELQKLFDRIKEKLAAAWDQEIPEADRKKAAGELPELIKENFAKKSALKQSLLDSLLE